MAKKKVESQGSPKREPPVHEIRLGRLRASVWRNEHATEGVWYSVTLTRGYKDAQGQWHSASSFGRDDLLAVGELTRLAYHWIVEQSKASTTAGNGGAKQQGVPPSSEDGKPIPF